MTNNPGGDQPQQPQNPWGQPQQPPQPNPWGQPQQSPPPAAGDPEHSTPVEPAQPSTGQAPLAEPTPAAPATPAEPVVPLEPAAPAARPAPAVPVPPIAPPLPPAVPEAQRQQPAQPAVQEPGAPVQSSEPTQPAAFDPFAAQRQSAQQQVLPTQQQPFDLQAPQYAAQQQASQQPQQPENPWTRPAGQQAVAATETPVAVNATQAYGTGQQPTLTAPSYPQDAQTVSYGGFGGEPPAAAPPKKKRKLWPWISAAVVVLLLVVGGIVGLNIGNAAHTPELRVEAYLDALKAGKAETALELVGMTVAKTDLLLSDAAYGEASDRIKRYSITESETSGDTATVTAKITQGSESYDQEFTLTKVGTEMLVFDVWELKAPELSTVAVDVNAPADAAVTVAGVDISGAESDAGRYEFRALPGTYPVALGGETTWYSAEEQSATVVGFGQTDAEVPLLNVTLTEDGATAAAAAVNAYLDTCIASTELVPAGCPFFGINIRGYELSNIHWTVTKPVFSVAGDYSGAGWAVATDTEGTAVATADARDPSSGATGTVSTSEMSVSVGGSITGFTDEGATYVP